MGKGGFCTTGGAAVIRAAEGAGVTGEERFDCGNDGSEDLTELVVEETIGTAVEATGPRTTVKGSERLAKST